MACPHVIHVANLGLIGYLVRPITVCEAEKDLERLADIAPETSN